MGGLHELCESGPPSAVPPGSRRKRERIVHRDRALRSGRQWPEENHSHGTGTPVGQWGMLTQRVDGVQDLEIGDHLRTHHWRNGSSKEVAHEQ